MRIGIYGDSFSSPVSAIGSASLEALAWPRLLERDHQVTNRSIVGSSLYWTMEEFERTCDQYDRVIVAITNPGRWPGVIFAEGMPVQGIPGYAQALMIEEQLKNRKHWPNLEEHRRSQLLKQVRDVAAWYLGQAQHMGFERYVHGLMINRIRSLRPDAIIVPINTILDLSWGLALDHVTFSDYAQRSLQWFGLTPTDGVWPWLNQHWRENHIVCHLTEEANYQVYRDMLTAIEDAKWAPKLPQVIAHAHDWDYYYKSL